MSSTKFAGQATRTIRKGLLALALLCKTAVAGEVSVELDSKTLRIQAVEATTYEILDAVADETGLEVFSSAPLDRIVTLRMTQTSVPALVRRLFRNDSYLLIGTNEDYALWIHNSDATSQSVHMQRRVDPAAEPWDAVVNALNSDDPNRRIDAVFALADVGPSAHVDLLRASLDDEDANVQQAAIEVLGDMGAVAILREHWPDLAVALHFDVVDAVGDSQAPGRRAFLRFVAGLGEPRLTEAAMQYLEEDPW